MSLFRNVHAGRPAAPLVRCYSALCNKGLQLTTTTVTIEKRKRISARSGPGGRVLAGSEPRGIARTRVAAAGARDELGIKGGFDA